MKPDRPLVDAAGTRYADRSLKELQARQMREYARKMLEYHRTQAASRVAADVAASPIGNLATGNQATGLAGLLRGMDPVNKMTPADWGAQAGQALKGVEGDKVIKDYLARDQVTTPKQEPDSRITGPLHTVPDPRFALPGGVTSPDNFKFSQGMAFPELDVSYRQGGSQMNPIEAYIRQSAQKRGIDPDVAVRVASSEGGLKDPFRQGESMLSYGREESYGPFQLHMRMGGVGTRALAAGIDPRKDWQGGIDYALNEAAQKGWGQWYGAAKAGVGNRMGLGGAHSADIAPPFSPAALDFVKNNPQPGGFGAGVPDSNAAVFGSMAPGIGGGDNGTGGFMPQNNSIDPAVAAYAFSDDKKQDRLGDAGKAFSAAAKKYPAPDISGGGGDARATGDVLLKMLSNPQALAQMMMQRRMA